MSSSPSIFSRCLQVGRQCAPVAVVAGAIFAILVSARSAPKDPVGPAASARVERIDTGRSDLARSNEQTNAPGVAAARASSQTLLAGERVPLLNTRYGSFNSSLVKPVQANASGRVRTPRARLSVTGEAQPSPRGINIDVLSSRTSRPVEVGRNGTSTPAEIER
jgi:hypothetical protein